MYLVFIKKNIYIYDILLNQLQLIMSFNDEIVYGDNKYFLIIKMYMIFYL